MATVLKTYKVHYHFENAGKISGPTYVDYVQATANDYASLKTVLSNNSKLLGGGTLVIDSVQDHGHGDVAVA